MTVNTHNNTKGLVRAFDVRTGKQLWRFNTIPRTGEFGNETWEENSWSYNGNTGVWTQISVDEELGLAYLPIETPTSDFYGGHRPGNNLFAETLVAVDLKTGQRKWHYQLVHHPIWNFDNCCASLLADVTINGKPQQGRRAAEQAGVALRARPRHRRADLADRGAAGAAVRRAGREDLADAAAPDQAAGLRAQLHARAGRRDRLHAGAAAAGARGPEALQVRAVAVQPADSRQRERTAARRASDPAPRPTGRAPRTIPRRTPCSRRRATCRSRRASLVEPPKGFTDIRYVSGLGGQPFREIFGPGDCCSADSGRRTRDELPGAEGAAAKPAAPPAPAKLAAQAAQGLNVQGLSIVKPPYGVLTAVNLDRGEIVWQVPHGDTPDNIRNHPALKGLNIPKTGQPGTSGVGLMVTKTRRRDGRSAGHQPGQPAARRDAPRLRQEDRRSRSASC